MRATAMGLVAAAVLGLTASLAHADPYFGGPPPAAPSCNPNFYASNGCCWYGPNYCFQGPVPARAPFNGMLAIPQQYTPAYASVPGVPRPAGFPPYAGGPPAGPGPACFATHPFARSPRDYFMFGQTHND